MTCRALSTLKPLIESLILASAVVACSSSQLTVPARSYDDALGRDFGLTSTAGRIAYLANDGGYWQVWVAVPGQNGARQITESPYEKAAVSWFPDGERVLVHALSGRLFVVDVRSGDEEPFSAASYGGHDAVVSPDGRTIAVSSSLTTNLDTNEIVLIDVAKREQKVLPSATGMQHTPSWSSDCDWIYYVAPTDSKLENNLWRVHRSGLHIEQLTVDAAYQFAPSVSHEGVVAYASNRTGDYDIWAWDIERGTQPRQLTNRLGFDGEPDWGPDGRHLAYVAREGTVSTVRIMDAETGRSWELANHKRGARAPAWWGALGGE